MSSPPNATSANTTTGSEIAALQAVANTQFIAQSAQAIANAIAMGLQYVVCTTFENCNLTDLMNYYNLLGYTVVLPEVHYQVAGENTPYSFYGVDYYQWLTNSYIFGMVCNPVRLRIMWNLPNVNAVAPVPSTQTSTYAMTRNNEVVTANAAGGSFTVSLPATPANGWIETVTVASSAHPLTISGNGNNINGSSTPLTSSVAGTTFSFLFFSGYGWTTL